MTHHRMPDQSAARDRFTFAMLLALLVHGLLLAVSFVPDLPRPSPSVLDVTLAHFRSEQAPRDADFVAQASQVGSGTEKEKRLLTTTEQALLEDDRIQETLQAEEAVRAPAPESQRNLVVTRSERAPRRAGKAAQKRESREAQRAEQERAERRRKEIASLEAQLAREKEAYAKRPKVRQLTSVSTRESFDALYVEAFRREVEAVGTRNFPEQALQERKFGQVRLMVALDPDGAIREIEILQSSGHRFLDDAAVRSVRLAAPFAPFPAEMRRITDILEIIRTWKYDEQRALSSEGS